MSQRGTASSANDCALPVYNPWFDIFVAGADELDKAMCEDPSLSHEPLIVSGSAKRREVFYEVEPLLSRGFKRR